MNKLRKRQDYSSFNLEVTMKKYVTNVIDPSINTAGPKAKEDVVAFLSELDFEIINNKIPNNKILRPFLGRMNWKKNLDNISDDSLVVYQYPSFSRLLDRYFIKKMIDKKNVTTIVIIHDLESLRNYSESDKDIKEELSFLSKFDFVIAHNTKMKSWLEDNSDCMNILTLELFDYKNFSPMTSEANREIAFVGNLKKSSFLSNLSINTNISLYGVNPQKTYSTNIFYKGVFPPDLLGEQINETFGLVWDGDSIESCTGIVGNYIKYNNPHKASFYLSMGMPIIIWTKAALAEFVIENNCGFVVNSLDELDMKMSMLTNEELILMKRNAEKIGIKVRNGFYINKILESMNLN